MLRREPPAKRIAQLVARGRTNREIAAELGVSEKTVEWHLSRLYRKFGVRSRTELTVVVLGGRSAPREQDLPRDARQGTPSRPS